MASKYLLVASLLFFSLTSTNLANYSPATSYLITTCDDATYSTECLQTLLPDVERINGNPKKSTRLAISATIGAAQTGSTNIAKLSKQPQVWSREANSLNDCSTSINDLVNGLTKALNATDHLGGGSSSDKESKRLNMVNDVKPVLTVINSCLNNLQGLKARDVVVKRVQGSTTPLNHLATNVIDLINRMKF